MLDILIGACCRDLQEEAGFVKKSTNATAESKKGGAMANADLYLPPQSDANPVGITLDPEHKAAAEQLLAALLSYLPQQHLKPALRALLDQTAIVTQNKGAMVASVLNPFRDQRQKMYPSILPYLARQFPHDEQLEILRSNLHTSAQSMGDLMASIDEIQEEQEDEGEDEDEDEEMVSNSGEPKPARENGGTNAPNTELPEAVKPRVDSTPSYNIFQAVTNKPDAREETPIDGLRSPGKRAFNDADEDGLNPPKRVDLGKESEAITTPFQPSDQNYDQPQTQEDSDSDNESAHLVGELDTDEEENS
jgi:hypothetical protein